MKHDSTNWQQTLGTIEQAIQQCLTTLDRYEKKFERLLGTNQTRPVAGYDISQKLQQSQQLWDEHLRVAEQTMDQVEVLFQEQEKVWERWLNSYQNWEQSLQTLSGTH